MSEVLSRAIEHVVRPEAAALLMWDFQVGLGGHAFDYDRLIRVSRRLLAAADDAGVPVIWSQHAFPSLDGMTPGMLYFLMNRQDVDRADELRPFMEPGSPDRAFVPELQPRPHDIVIEKYTPSFFVGTQLELRLKALGVETVVIAGVATEIGVDLTAKHAIALGYVPVVVEDAVDSYSPQRQQLGLAALRSWIPVVSSSEILDVWSP